jgi:hypothetical protein
MAEPISEQELEAVESRARSLPDSQADARRDLLRLVAEVRRLRDQAGGVEYRPGALEDEVM